LFNAWVYALSICMICGVRTVQSWHNVAHSTSGMLNKKLTFVVLLQPFDFIMC
jgi:hypothetical protein